MFARAGRSGYVLKPELLRKKGLEKDKESLNRVSQYILELEVITMFEAPSESKSLIAPHYVRLFPRSNCLVRGILRFRTMRKQRKSIHLSKLLYSFPDFPLLSNVEPRSFRVYTPCPSEFRPLIISQNSGNAYNPIFRSVFTLPFQSNPSPGMLDLVFLRLEVLNARGNLKSAAEEGKGEFVGAYTTGIGGLLSGASLFCVWYERGWLMEIPRIRLSSPTAV